MRSAPLNPMLATVLVVDDSPAMLRYLRTLLELESYHVETARNGAQALKRLRGGCSPAVVVLDLQMPGMDGLATLRQLKRRWPEIKVIICSGADDPVKTNQAAALGAYAYLHKPVQPLYLSAAVQRCIGEGYPSQTPLPHLLLVPQREYGKP